MQKIAKIGSKLGAIIPKLRLKNLAKDTTKSEDVIMYVLNNISEEYDYLVLLEPTSPFTTTLDVDQAIYELNKIPFYKSIVSYAK